MLKGIKSLNQTSYLTDDMVKFLYSEGFNGKTSVKPLVTQTKTKPQLYKSLGGDANNRYNCWVTNSEIIVENVQAEHDTPVTAFNKSFNSDESFVEAYNLLVDFYEKF